MTNREAALLDMGLNPDDFVESKIDPALFELADWPNTFKDLDYPTCPCAMCGHLCRWIVGFKHLPSGAIIYVGEDCANYLDSENVIEKQMKQFKTKIANEKEDAKKQAEFDARRAEFAIENSDVIKFLVDAEAQEQAWRDAEKPTKLKAPLGFVIDMVYAYNKWGSLTPKQTDAVRNIAVKQVEYEAKKAAEIKPEKPLVEGRQEIVGEVVGTPWKDGYFPGDRVKKLIVKLDDGNKVYGTCPKAIYNVQVGAKVSFLGTVEQSKDDENFGFYRKPTKAVIELTRTCFDDHGCGETPCVCKSDEVN